MEIDYQKQRMAFVAWVKEQLTGIKLPDDTLIGVAPLDRFFSAILFPLQPGEFNSSDDDVEEQDNEEAQPVRHIIYRPPSSAGFSFFVTGEQIELRVNCQAVHYKEKKEKRDEKGRYIPGEWVRTQLAPDDGEEKVFTLNGDTEYILLDDKVRLSAVWRQYKQGYIATVSIANLQKTIEHTNNNYKELNETSLFEVALTCFVERGCVANYPNVDRALLSDEEKEIELRYKDIFTLAVGHGTGVNWRVDKGVTVIRAEFMPTVEVPQVTTDTSGTDSEVLRFDILLSCEDNPEVFEKLTNFVIGYENWIKEQQEKALKEPEEDQKTARKLIENLDTAKKRMEHGINLLKEDEHAKIAFALANKAMLKQMIAVDLAAKREQKESEEYKWRPFQLAFILMTLASTANGDDEYRDMLDLIWFPTGGGKTEAYLGLLAFFMMYRRLRHPSSYGGTVAIMRYTLRLLTAQQFTRAAKVICALELIRQTDVARFGKERFSIGLWVGEASSPNTCSQAFDQYNDGKYSKFIIINCPWCGVPFTKENYLMDKDSSRFRCTHQQCDFGKNPDNTLPCNTVDEMLYKEAPSLLIATVDKFAALAWDERPGIFFGVKGNLPPELIIQDELHLIAGELGSIVGLYEVGIDTLLEKRGVRPKYIASTATVKNAASQVQALYGRRMQVFPPSGLRYDDSYFAKTIPISEKNPGRMFIGFLSYFPPKNHCLSSLTATLLAAPVCLFNNNEEFMDSWWSQVIYHGSLKGVGNSRTLYQSDVLKYLNRLILESMKNSIEDAKPGYLQYERFKCIEDYEKISDPEIKQIVSQYLPVRKLAIKTLTSRQTAEENNKVFADLASEYNQNNAVDILLATNMISVGLDVNRLSLMVINGQPLTTAEYIQASSRVGRSKVPGLVFVNYYKTQARSLSHYENFRSYHASYYRFVEPSSLTPFTYPAKVRALHAALVIAARHGIKFLSANESAEKFDKDNEEVKKLLALLRRRITDAILPFDQDSNEEINISDCEESLKQAIEHLDNRIDEWEGSIKDAQHIRQNLFYRSNDQGVKSLLLDFHPDNNLNLKNKWQTLRSMRNVENNALLRLVGGVKGPS